jgi:cytochrome P450
VGNTLLCLPSILTCYRQILHDEATYGPDTDDFNPERFLKPGVNYPNAAFGYGRRWVSIVTYVVSRYY